MELNHPINYSVLANTIIKKRSASKMPLTIFVGGVWGAGKTTLSELLCESLPFSVYRISVGRIACEIAERMDPSLNSIECAEASFLNICQKETVKSINTIINANKEYSCFILDGHYVLPSTQRETYRLPNFFFKELGINLLVVCQCEQSIIKHRLESRNTDQRPMEIVLHRGEKYIQEEKEYAEKISSMLLIPLIKVHNSLNH
ncbi:MAG: AAA family ATPase [Bacteroidota bacterium]